MNSKLLVILFLCFLASSCAPRTEVKPEKKMPVQPPAETLILPEVAPKEVVEPAETVKKPETEQKAPEQYIMLNFENADIETVVATISEMLKINYILAPGVSGKITIQSHSKVPLSELFSIFQTVLEFNGFTAVRDGSFYRIVPIDTARQQPVPVESGKDLPPPSDSGFVTQKIPLEYVKANDIANIVRNLMPRGTDIIVYEPSNMLIITAPPSGIIKLLKLLESIDIPATERDTMRTFVYNVENGEAKKLASILNSIYGGKKDSSAAALTKTTPAAAPPAPVRARTPRVTQLAAAPATGATVQEGLAAEIEGEVIIEAYEDINSLIIQTTPRGYLSLLETIKKLDIQPKQVLIEVLIAEITLDDTTKFGIEWLLKGEVLTKDGIYNLSGGFTSGNIGFDTETKGFISSLPTGAFANIFDPARFNALISAAASADKINVIASPHILALDNKEAKIEIADEVPVATSISQPQDTTANTISQVQFKSAGTILTVTPHINEKKQVSLNISQEVSEIGSTVKIADQEYQGFKTRKANTTAIVQDGHTLVLGGIITGRKQKTRSGIPLLSRIPVLGYLFGSTTDVDNRKELILMVTPHVVSNSDEADKLTEDYKNRVKELKKRIEERENSVQADSHIHDVVNRK